MNNAEKPPPCHAQSLKAMKLIKKRDKLEEKKDQAPVPETPTE
jgi:hypothetical protein